MVTRVSVDSATVSWARMRCSLTVERAAELLDCKPEHLQKIEVGEILPSATLFRKMADVYLLPEATLLGLVPASERPLPKDLRSFESMHLTLSYETIVAARLAQARQEAIARLAAIDDKIIAPQLPIHTLSEDPEKLGAAFRRDFGFPVIEQLTHTTDHAFMRWRMKIEDMGVSVYIEPMGYDDSRGLSVFFNDFPAIVIDQHDKHAGAKTFTLFHEYAHLLLRQAGISDHKWSSDIEAFCNKFAAAFLLPPEAVRAVLNIPDKGTIEPSIGELDAAARKLCVTISQLALRLEALGFAKGGYYSSIAKKLKHAQPKPPTGGEWRYTYVSRYGYYLPAAVIGSLERGQINPVQASRILEASPAHLPAVKQTLDERRAMFAHGG